MLILQALHDYPVILLSYHGHTINVKDCFYYSAAATVTMPHDAMPSDMLCFVCAQINNGKI
jgi:hypothetical protein